MCDTPLTDSLPGESSTPMTLEQNINSLRGRIQDIGNVVRNLRRLVLDGSRSYTSADEMYANLELSYRHLEDARMRLGKVLQAKGGGVSVYDKEAPTN